MTKFERDKVYKTRDGRDARIVCVDRPGRRPLLALVTTFGNGDECDVMGYYEDGRFRPEGAVTTGSDLMLPKPEPIVEWGLVRISDNQWADGYGTERTARAIAADPENVPRFRLAKRVTTFED